MRTLNEYEFFFKVALDQFSKVAKHRKQKMSKTDLKLYVIEYNKAFSHLNKVSDAYELAMWNEAIKDDDKKELTGV